jgi:hypothetical protein
MFAQKVLAWVRVEGRRRMAKILSIQEVREKNKTTKKSSSLEIILMIKIAPVLWNKQSQA